MRKDSNLLLANQLKMMQTNIQIFTSEIFGNIRTCQVNNQIMFVGKDVATALGYSNTSKAIQQHVDHEDKGILPIRETAYETRAVFKRWVTSEVLPQIRQTGGYIPTKDAQGRELSAEEIIDRADTIIGHTIRMLNDEAEDTLTATQVAKTFNMSVYDFNAILRDMGIQYRRDGRWNISDDLVGRDLVRLRTHVSYSLKGKKKVRTYMTWTVQGLHYLNSKLGYPNF